MSPPCPAKACSSSRTKLQDLAPSFRMDRRVIVLSAARMVLPTELQTTNIVLDELRSTKSLSVTRREEIDALRTWARERAVIAN